MARDGLDPARPVVVEAESSRIGRLNLPPALWEAMRAAPRIELSAALELRAGYLARRYRDLTADPARLMATVAALAARHPRERIEAWGALAEAGAFEALAAGLMAEHYDPLYAVQRARFEDRPLHRVRLDRLDADGLAAALPQVVAAVAALSPG